MYVHQTELIMSLIVWKETIFIEIVKSKFHSKWNLGFVCYTLLTWEKGLAGGSEVESSCQCRRHRRHGLDPWIGKMPWRRKWQPTSVFLPWTEDSGGPKFMGSQESQTWLSDWAHRQHEIIWLLCLECRQHGSTLSLLIWGFGLERLEQNCWVAVWPKNFSSLLSTNGKHSGSSQSGPWEWILYTVLRSE